MVFSRHTLLNHCLVTMGILGLICNVHIASSERYCNTKKLAHSFPEHWLHEEQCEPLPEAPPKEDTPDLELFELLNYGSEILSNYTSANEAVLLLGNTGSGKSTVTQIMAGNLSRLYAVVTPGDELVIIDEEDRIGLPSTKSKTLFPELVYKEENSTQLAFYDNPGFDDTRGHVKDIAANYFINLVTSTKITKAKLLFLVIHSSVKPGNDRLDFDLLVTHATTFIKNIEKYGSSIALIVNKVANFNSRGQYMEDHIILEGIGDFLVSYNETLYSELSSGDLEKDRRIRKKIFFIETLLETNKDTGSFTRIWFVRSPCECGRLSNLLMMQDTRYNLTKLYSSLEFTNVDAESDFGFTLKPETKNQITNYTKVINSNIEHVVSTVITNLEYHYNKTVSSQIQINSLNTSEVHLLTKQFRDSIGTAIDIIKGGSVSTSTEFTSSILPIWQIIKLPLSSKFQDFMITQEDYLAFFEKVTETLQDRLVRDWAASIELLFKYISMEVDWFEFCQSLDKLIKTYDFQSTKSSLPAKSPNNPWFQYIIENNIVVVSDAVKDAEKRLAENRVALIGYLMDFSVNTIQYFCIENSTLVLQQNLITMQNIITSISQFADQCQNQLTHICVFAAHTIYLDASPRFGSIGITLIAPNFENPTERDWSLLLEGSAGKSYNSRASDGKHGSRGYDGCRGGPGKPGGRFFGLTQRFGSTKNRACEIVSYSGNGGKGQDGGKGGDGQPNRSNSDPRRDVPNLVLSSNCYHFGFRGFDAGNGGDGGLSGNPGEIGSVDLVQLDSAIQCTLRAIQGKSGLPGSYGIGGYGSKAADGYNCGKCDVRNCEFRQFLEHGNSGYSGVSNISTICAENQEPSPAQIRPWYNVILFKKAFWNLPSQIVESFFNDLDTNAKTKQMFSLKGFTEEFLELETIRKNLKDFYNASFGYEVDYIHTKLESQFHSLIRRIERFSMDYFDSSTKDQQKLITMLLSSSHNSMVNVRSQASVGLVLDISSYFDTVKQRTKLLRALEEQEKLAASLQAILSTRTEFETNIFQKIDQVLGYIEADITPSIDEAGNEIETVLGSIEMQLQNLILDAKLSLEDCKKKLRKEEKKQKRLKGLKMFGLIVKIGTAFGPLKQFKGLSSVVDMLTKKFEGQPGQLERLKEMVKETENLLNKLEEEQQTLDEFIPLVESLVKYFKDVQESLISGTDVSAPGLEITKWKVTSKLKDCQNAMSGLADSALTMYPLARAFDRMHDALVLTIDLYEMIENYLETMALAEYIAALQSAALQPIPITDPEFSNYVLQFELTIQQNLLEEEVKKAFHSVKQWAFPFAKFFTYSLTNQDHNAVLAVGDAELRQVEELYIQLERYKTGIVASMDTFIIQTNFSSGIKTSKPFFVWKNENWQTNIQALISGDSVKFNADVRLQGFEGWESIKFRLIEINFKLNNAKPGFQEEFGDLLEYFGVSMTHSGVSYYKFQDKYYTIAGDNQTIRYNFERDINGNRLGTNQVYEKFKNGDYILSPFTMWTIQLRNVIPTLRTKRGKTLRENVSFEDLQKFLPYMELELVGMGTYVDGVEAVNAGGDLQLDKYYERDDRFQYQINF